MTAHIPHRELPAKTESSVLMETPVMVQACAWAEARQTVVTESAALTMLAMKLLMSVFTHQSMLIARMTAFSVTE
jgi:hypothetical protein